MTTPTPTLSLTLLRRIERRAMQVLNLFERGDECPLRTAARDLWFAASNAMHAEAARQDAGEEYWTIYYPPSHHCRSLTCTPKRYVEVSDAGRINISMRPRAYSPWDCFAAYCRTNARLFNRVEETIQP